MRLLLSLLALLPALACAGTSPNDRPNILFAIADDWSWCHAGVSGDGVVKTPTYDSIAANGLLFNNAYASSPSCTPSRNAILTGQFFARLKEGANLHSQFPVEMPVYPALLESAGYFTGSYRKSFGPGKAPEGIAGKKFQGFQEFLDARPKDQPFCFWFGSSDPHRPYEPGSGAKAGIDPAKITVPPYLPDCPEIRSDIADYYFEVQRFDREVGEALELLRQRGELDNTLVFMTADNGWPFPRGKATLYDSGTRMPLAVQWPARAPKGRVVQDFVMFSDFAPTFLDAAGIKPPPQMSGASLLPLIEGKTTTARPFAITGRERHTPAQTDSFDAYPARALRNDGFLIIHNFKPARWPAGDPVTSQWGKPLADIDAGPSKTFLMDHKEDPATAATYQRAVAKRPEYELYDLRQDPHQLVNVAENPEYSLKLEELKKQLDGELKRLDDPRATGHGDAFDSYPYLGSVGNSKKDAKE